MQNMVLEKDAWVTSTEYKWEKGPAPIRSCRRSWGLWWSLGIMEKIWRKRAGGKNLTSMGPSKY